MKRSFSETSLVFFYCIVFTLCVVLSQGASAKPGPGQPNPPCGKGGKGDCPKGKPGSGCGSAGANPINPAKANAYREIPDITTFGAAPIEWGRIINSRLYQHNGNAYWEFGYYGTSNSGAQWQSSWQSSWNFEIFNVSGSVIRQRYPAALP